MIQLSNLEFPTISIPALAIIFVTSLLLLMGRDWRWMIAALAVQYVGVFLLVTLSWPLSIALIKVIAGWMTGAILGTAPITRSWLTEERSWPSSRLFRLFASLLVWLVVFSAAPSLLEWIPSAGLARILGSFILISMGLMQLGLTAHPLRVVIGLLTMLSGFEIIYAVMESSLLVAGLLAGVHLALALAGSFMLYSISMEEEL
jgi:hypothetical protein